MLEKERMIRPTDALPGRTTSLVINPDHFVHHVSMTAPFPAGFRGAYFAMGCFWGVERLFWEQPGVYVTAAGYQGGYTQNPTYEEVCTGKTGHAESVLVVFDPAKTSYATLLQLFWENHNPTQGSRQGGDIGTQYRSVLFATDDAMLTEAQQSKDAYQSALDAAGQRNRITTEVVMAPEFYYAEEYHQQYLEKNPDGYCGLGGIGVCFPKSLAGHQPA
jgi:peptide-methionine (S)-S-oxide reductase